MSSRPRRGYVPDGPPSGVPADDDLMMRASRGDNDAFRQIVERWEYPVFVFLHRMLASEEEARDAGQETFLRVYRHADRYVPTGTFKNWLFRIAGNLARSRLRRRKIIRWTRFSAATYDEPSNEEPVDTRLERRDDEKRVRAALDRLPGRQLQAVVLRYFENMSYREIAQSMGISIPAVESLLHRGSATLRRELLRKKMIE
jgi:RNA polymerase sigma-70 factor, ECF subfamily